MAYKVYYGTLRNPLDDKDQARCYGWNSRELCYDSSSQENDSLMLMNPVLTREVNQAGTFEADVPVSNSCYRKLMLVLGTVEVERDGEVIWQGRIINIEMNFDKSKHIYCEGELAYLNDYYNVVDWDNLYMLDGSEVVKDTCSPSLAFGYCCCNISENGKYIGTEPIWNDHIGDDQWYRLIGMIRGTSTGIYDSKYVTGWDFLTNKYINGIMQNVSDYVYTRINRTTETGINSGKTLLRRKLDLIVMDPELDGKFMIGSLPETKQTIEFGKNLTDLTITYNVPDDLVTRAKAYGYAKKGWWIFSSTNTIVGQAQNDELIAKYGVIERVVSIDGMANTEEKLNTLAKGLLTDSSDIALTTINVKAIDLVDSGESGDRLDFMKMTRIKSDPHGVDIKLVCTKLVEPLDDPSRKEFTYGKPQKSLSVTNAHSSSKTDASYSMSWATKDYVTNS